ncbi:kinase-like protein [Melanomma pulvis-pyrius CBS 109.77]|uniref:Kinase-like protein n=1 Tax=Melanomma pulvis-pyrius CBS 109.77 TaxID=1314802 RepID=A0A6A6WS06_9PLEO|nr:kinase-like protein [Melanomma pulvis-pyrius CBS 109.77]
MAVPTSLSSEEGLRAYLTSKSIGHTDVTLLTGGTANYVYRVTLIDGSTVIYKHAAPYLSSNPNFAFNPARMDYEDRVLEILPPLLTQELPECRVHPVKWHSYDKEQKLLCIEDGGDKNLKDAYTCPKLDIPVVGQEIGNWIAALHMCSTQTSLSLSSSQDLKANNSIGVTIYRHSYQNLHLALKEYGHRPELGEYINNVFGSQLAVENDCICHGDFWSGNVLVKFQDEETNADLTVVDWEMTRRGTSATDVGQFAAEAFLLDRFRGGRGLMPAFLHAYARARKQGDIGKEWVRRMAVHWGVHITFWPTRVQWTDREGTQKLVDIGVGVLKAAVDGNWEQLRASELLGGVADVYIGA